jgi:hypothetical protein
VELDECENVEEYFYKSTRESMMRSMEDWWISSMSEKEREKRIKEAKLKKREIIDENNRKKASRKYSEKDIQKNKKYLPSKISTNNGNRKFYTKKYMRHNYNTK